MGSMKKWCELCIMRMPISCTALNHAVLHQLADREAQCVSAISRDIRAHLDEITEMGNKMSSAAMQRLWPSICQAACVHVPFPEGFNAGLAFPSPATTTQHHAHNNFMPDEQTQLSKNAWRK